jgi:trans-aconitate 2-methyltransferase
MQWDPQLYLEFDAERTQAAIDLVSRIPLARPGEIADLGCGPGNSTAVLARRWPDARITGVDHSAEMLERAASRPNAVHWVRQDIACWDPDEQFDLVFSNAALQWVPRHPDLLPRLMRRVRAGGVFAMQIPYHLHSRVHALIEETAGRFACRRHVFEIRSPEEYYDILAPHARRVDAWITEYLHVMEDAASIVRWMRGTGLRPYLEGLAGSDQAAFLETLGLAIAREYPRRVDGRVLFPFARLFLIAAA